MNSHSANNYRSARWLLAFVSPLLLIFGLQLLEKIDPPPENWRIEQVDALLSDDLVPPAAHEAWTNQVVPLSVRSLGRRNSLWYRIELAGLPYSLTDELENYASEPWTLAIGAPMGAVALFQNGELIQEIGQRSEPLSVYRRPLGFSLTPRQMASGDALYVHMQRLDSRGWVYASYLAPQSELTSFLSHQRFMRLQLPRVLQVVMCTICAIMLLLLWMRPSDTEYGWWALMLLSWALREATDTSADPWLSDRESWIVVRNLGLGGFALFGYLFIKSYIGKPHTLFDKAVFLSGIIWTSLLLVLAFTDVLTRELSNSFWTPWVVMVAVLCCVVLWQAAREKQGHDIGWLLAVCWCVSVTGFYDYRVAIDPYAIAGYVQYLQYCAAIALTVFTAILMRRFARALRTAENANVALEERVALQRVELEESYSRTHAAEKQQLVNEERERIMRDMHDGIGGQLVQALSMVSQDTNLAPIEPTLREALDDLRLIIDSLSVPEGKLSVLLATLRHRPESANCQGRAYVRLAVARLT